MPEAFITASAVGHAHGDRQILENINLTVHAGDRVSLVVASHDRAFRENLEFDREVRIG